MQTLLTEKRIRYESLDFIQFSEADLRYVEHLCRRAKIALSLVFRRRLLLFLLSYAVV